MFSKTKAIVLKSQKYGENSRVIQMYTYDRGTVSFQVNIGEGKRSRSKSAYFMPLSLLEVEYAFREKYSLQKFQVVNWDFTYQTIPYNPYKSSMVFFLAEFLSHALKKEPQNVFLFQFIVHALKWLDHCEGSYANFHLVFLMKMMTFLGIPPNLEGYQGREYFDMRESVLCTDKPQHNDYLEPEEVTFLVMMDRLSFETMQMLQFCRQDRNKYLNILNKYFQIHLPGFPELKSLFVLSDIFV